MHIFRSVLTPLILCLAIAPAVGQGEIPFLDATVKATRNADLTINSEVIPALQNTTGSLTVTGVPLVTGISGDFVLRPSRVFTDDVQFIIMEDGGTTRPLNVTPKRGWIGSDPNHPNTFMFISANADSRVHAMILGDAETSVTVIKPSDEPGNTYRVVPNRLPKIPFCDNLPAHSPFSGISAGIPATRAIRSTTMFDVELTLDISHGLYNALGQSGENIVDYMVDLIGSMNIIYHRDLQLNWQVNNAFIWSTPDGFSAQHSEDGSSALTSADQLYNYRDYVAANRGGVHFDITHLVDAREELGGVAYVNVLQQDDFATRQYRSSVSNVMAIDSFPSDINQYYWDTMVITHELGHNVGSPHTHCYSPPIDCCIVDDPCSQCTTAAPAAGTIMSYCHFWIGSGGSMQMHFHPRSIARMRGLVESSPMLTVHVSQPEIEISGTNDTYVIPGSTDSAGATLKSSTFGGTPVIQPFTITNTGGLDLVLTGNPAVHITGNPLLSITSQPAQTTIAPGASTTFMVQYNPEATGSVYATITIPTNVPSRPTYSFRVTGQLVEPAPPVTTSFNGDVAIPESGDNYTVIPINVSGITGAISDVNVAFTGINCAIPTQTGLQHPAIGDLQLALQGPDGTRVYLMEEPGQPTDSLGANLCNTIFDDAPGNPNIQSITTAGAPYTGTYNPLQPLSAFNGKSPNGTWYLLAYDFKLGNTGSIRSVSLIISGEQPTTCATSWTLYN